MTMNSRNNPPVRRPDSRADGRDDPQIVLAGRFKNGPNSDMVTFSLNFNNVEFVFIVTIPEVGSEFSPVYMKQKVNAVPRQNRLFDPGIMSAERMPRRGGGRDGVRDDEHEEEADR